MLVSTAADDTPWPMTVDLVENGHITLAVHGDDRLPDAWDDLAEVHVTCVGQFSVYLIHVPVVRSGTDRLVIRAPREGALVQRRAYARVLRHVPVSCAVIDTASASWTTFEGEVRDLGGGGCSILTERTPSSGTTIAMALTLDDDAPFALIGRVLPREELPTIGKPLTRVEFALVRESDRDRIMRFVLLSLGEHRRADLRPG